MINSPRIDDIAYGQQFDDPGGYTDALVRSYADAARTIASNKRVLFVDLNQAMQGLGDSYRSLLYDGLHLSLPGGNLLYTLIEPVLTTNIINDTDVTFPLYDEVVANPGILNSYCSPANSANVFLKSNSYGMIYAFSYFLYKFFVTL